MVQGMMVRGENHGTRRRSPRSQPQVTWAGLATALAVVALSACDRLSGGDSPSATPAAAVVSTPAPVAPLGVSFVDVAQEAGLAGFVQISGKPDKPTILDSMGGGVAFLDYDRDGDLDIYFTNGSTGSTQEGFAAGREARDALYRNDGDGRFSDVTAAARLGDAQWTMGVTVADYDNDGWPDIYLTNYGPNVLYHNRGDGSFEDVTAVAGVGDPHWSMGAAFFDYDNDGDLDLYVANYVDFDPHFTPADPSFCTYRGVMVYYGPRGLKGAPDTLYRNDGKGRFSDVTAAAGIRDPNLYGFQPLAFDYDGDGDIDVYVADDLTPNLLWRNNGDGTFTEVGLGAGVAVSEKGKEQGSMGMALGDYNGDGLPDIYVTNFTEEYHTLYRNDGGGYFSDVTGLAHLAEPTWNMVGWGTAFIDYDNDGDQDLYAANGHVYPQVDKFDFATRYLEPSQLFENRGAAGFGEVTARAGPGFAVARAHRGSAAGDYDDDGDVDLVLNNLDQPAALLRNDGGNREHWLEVLLEGSRSNRDALGARVVVSAGGRRQGRWRLSGSSFLSSEDPRLHFGLGREAEAESLVVTWPDASVESFSHVAADRRYRIVQGKGSLETLSR